MKQKIKFLGMLVLVMVIMVVSVVSMSEEAFAANTRPGHRLYNAMGQRNGCQEPGTDCTYIVDDSWV